MSSDKVRRVEVEGFLKVIYGEGVIQHMLPWNSSIVRTAFQIISKDKSL